MKDYQKIISDFGHIERRGNIITLKIRIAPDENRERTEMSVNFNADTGRVLGDEKSILAFVEHYYLPVMASRIPDYDGEGQLTDEIEKAKADIANASPLIDHCKKQIAIFAGGLGTEKLMREFERVFSNLQKDN
ncbi:MAG: hypothetical protein OXH16_21460 [Gemmatimonadetes bacterium]|nr:hypothetical protein [Gemmatimonadota bacterium]